MRKWRRFVLGPLFVAALVALVAAEQGPGAKVVPFDGAAGVATKATTTTTGPSVVVGADTTDSDLSAAPGEWRMTGGGTIAGETISVTRGFIVRCNLASPLPNRLEVNWGKGEKFHLEKLTSASCTDDPAIAPQPPVAPFDTYTGSGTGRLNGVAGATIYFRFTDAGEPGTSDTAAVLIQKDGKTVLAQSGPIRNGNNQAHSS